MSVWSDSHKEYVVGFPKKKSVHFSPALSSFFLKSVSVCVYFYYHMQSTHYSSSYRPICHNSLFFFLLFFAFLRFFLLLSSLFSPPLAFSKVLGCRKKLEEGLIRQKNRCFHPSPFPLPARQSKERLFFSRSIEKKSGRRKMNFESL